MNTTHIVLIDDDKATNLFHTIILEKAYPGMTINAFQDANLALDFIKSSKDSIDIICCDLQMPYMSGWEFVEQFETLFYLTGICQAPVFICSNSIDSSDHSRASQFASVIACIEKPLKPNVLQSILRD